MPQWSKRLAAIAASPLLFAAAATGAAKLRDLWIHPRNGPGPISIPPIRPGC